MELILEPDTYTPDFNKEKKCFEDIITSNNAKFCAKYPNGLKCCNGNAFSTRASFINHTKTKGHIKWLEELMSDFKNSYKKIIDLEKL